MSYHPKHLRPGSLTWRTAALVGCLAVFLLSGGLLIHDLWRSGQERSAYQKLAQMVQEGAQAAGEAAAPEAEGAPPSGRLEQYQLLHEQNEDLAGWLYAEGTSLDYPVMYTPQEPEYYLHRGFDGSYAASGSLFLSGGCTPDGSHVIIYGHNMRNGSMFGELDLYVQEDYGAQHALIHYDTLDREGTYELLAVFYSRVYTDQDQGVFRYYQYTDLSDPAAFDEYVRQVKAGALYDTGVEARYGDKLLTLSTCSYHTGDGRLVVVARQAAEETGG